MGLAAAGRWVWRKAEHGVGAEGVAAALRSACGGSRDGPTG